MAQSQIQALSLHSCWSSPKSCRSRQPPSFIVTSSCCLPKRASTHPSSTTNSPLHTRKGLRVNPWKVCHSRQTKARRSGTVCAGGEAEAKTASRTPATPGSAKECVEEGLKQFQRGRVRDALTNFDRALTLKPSDEEAQAALYNKACCHVQREEWSQAYDALRVSLSSYNLKFSTILNDTDMAPFRATREFNSLRNEAREGGQEIGQGYRRDLKLISEVQAPFRGVRLFAYAGLSSAAGIATLFTIPRLINALKGGEDALPLLPELQNIGIDLGGIAVFVALFIWDKRKENEQLERIARDETLSRLPLRLQSGKLVELSQLRENTRPVSGGILEV